MVIPSISLSSFNLVSWVSTNSVFVWSSLWPHLFQRISSGLATFTQQSPQQSPSRLITDRLGCGRRVKSMMLTMVGMATSRNTSWAEKMVERTTKSWKYERGMKKMSVQPVQNRLYGGTIYPRFKFSKLFKAESAFWSSPVLQ